MRLKRKGRMRGGMRGKNMYFKLSIRNAKRSFSDYLLYLVTVSLLLAIMESSNAVALTGNELAGFQTASLPFLIVIILIILICRMNDFMLKQRAKEFASYLLMGMEKRKLTAMFLGEFWIMGACCFIIGASCGIAVSGFIYMTILRPDGVSSGIAASILGSSIFHTFLYFCLTEGICSFIIGCRLVKMQIGDLIQEEKRSGEFRSMEKCRRWGLLFGSSFVCFLAGVLCIAFLPDKSAFPLISVIAIPLLSTVFSGYRFFFGLLCRAREAHAEFLYRKSRLYPMSWMLSNPGTDALLNAVFCICMLFSAAAFQFGVFLLRSGIPLYDPASQAWMCFLQISLCILFFVVCFSMQALLLLTEIRREAGNLKILYYMGKSRTQIKGILQKQIALRLAMPMGMAWLLLFLCTPLVNWKLKVLFPDITENILLKSAGVYSLCVLCFYLLYFAVICRMSISTSSISTGTMSR